MKTSQNTPNKTSKAPILWTIGGTVVLFISCWVLYNFTQPAAMPDESALVNASNQPPASSESLTVEEEADTEPVGDSGQSQGEGSKDFPEDLQKKSDSSSNAQAQPQKEPRNPEKHQASKPLDSSRAETALDEETVGDVLSDSSVDWKDPQERAGAVARMKAAEERELAKAREIAKQQGLPLRVEFPEGGVRELVGIDRDTGELLYYETRNTNAAISTGADQLQLSPYSLDGTGLTVGVWDADSARVTHQEFNEGATSRINNMNSQPFDNHATHVAGTIAAAGVDAGAKGMVFTAIIDSYDWTSDVVEMTAAAAFDVGQFDTKLYLSNHSYGYSYGWRYPTGGPWTWTGTGTDQNAYDSGFGQYSWKSRDLDDAAYNSPYYLLFWAAGNENTDGPNNGNNCIIGGATVTYDSSIHPKNDGVYKSGFDTIGDHGVAKNLITVGAVNDAVTSGQRDPSKATIASFSSTGPVDDGRIKPDLVGNGVGLRSPLAGSDTAYASYSGTSMASPNLTGSAALLVELYRELFGSDAAMRASTLKGLLIHTASDIGNPGPDYTYGWGLVDVKSAADFLTDRSNFPSALSLVEEGLSSSNASDTYTFKWDGESAIRATLCWTDPAGASETAHDDRTPDLVNDLNLKLIAPDGTEYFPFVMPFVGTWTVASMSQNATTGVNTVDNVEQVLIANPGQAGTWTVEVTHAGSLTNNAQDYGLLVSGSFDPAGTLSFSSDSYSVDESAGTVTITVERTGGSEGGVSVDYATSDGSATAGVDYTATSGTLSWNNNNSDPKTFTIPIIDDSIHGDAQKIVTITLSNPSGIGITGTNPVTLTILEDDNQLPSVDAGIAQTVFLSGSEWSPSSLSPDLWLDASDSTSVTLNGSTVSQWDDKSGNNRHATQTTSGSQPTLTSGGLNSLNVLTFDGSSDFLNLDLDFMAGVDHSVFVITKTTVYNNIYGAANSGAGASSLHVGFRNNSDYRMNYWGNDWYGNISANFQAGAANLLNYLWLSGSSKEIFANGKSEGSVTGAGIVGTMAGGGRISNVTGHGYYGGDIAEFIAFGKSLTTGEREQLEGFLAHKWGTAALLDAAHPYKSVGPNSASADASLNATASDNDGDSLSYTWSVVSGPGNVDFGNPNAVDTTATFSVVGIYTLRLTVNDGYGTTVSDDVVITVEEEGTGPSISVSAISGDTRENGDTAIFTVVLTTQPTGDVTIGLSSSDTSEGTVSPTSLTFTSVNWDIPQTVTVAGVDDALDDGDQPYTIITAAASSSDGDYNGLDPNDVSVANLDDDFTLTVVAESGGGSTTGGGVKDLDDGPYAISATAASGYQFINWSVTSGSASIADAISASTTVTVSANATIEANFDPDDYTITYSGNGNTGGMVPNIQGKAHDVDLILASNTGNLVKNGFVFDGWNTAADGSGTAFAEGAAFNLNANTTLYAKWNSPPTVDAGPDQTVYLGSSEPWSPSSLTTLAWYDAADATTITASGGTVSQWNDKSGNGRNIDQATAGFQPSYASSTVSFDGTDDYLWNDAPFMYDNGQLDVFVVGGIAPTNDDRLLSEGSSSSTQPLYCIAQTDNLDPSIMSVYIRNDANNALSEQPELSATGAFNNTRQLYQWRDTGSQVSGRVNGGAATSSPYARSGSLTLDRFSMGTVLRSTTVAHINADVNEIVICSNLTDADRQKIEGYLAHKWGLAANLPAAHPYKNAAPGSPTATATLNATVSDVDGDETIQQWTKDAGPSATVAFGDDTAVDTTATFTEVGTYTLRLTADDSFQQASDTVTITVELPPLTVSILDAAISEDGGTTTATITRIGTAGDLVVTLNSSDTGEATVPATATILNGSSSVDITITGVPDGIVDGTQTVIITATADNNAEGSATVDVTDVDVITYNVTYDGNGSDGGTVPVDESSPYAADATVTVLGNTGSLAKTDNVFTGWNTAANGSGNSYLASDTFTITQNTTLYAQWSATYTGWTSGFSGTLTDPGAGVDFDNGGVETGLEWVYGGDPTSANDDATITPTIDVSDPEVVTFTFRRSDEAEADPNTSISVEYGSDLGTWNTAAHNGSSIIITETDDYYDEGVDRVEVSIDWSLFTGDKAFVHLRVDITP